MRKTLFSQQHRLSNKIDIIIQNYNNYKPQSPKVKHLINNSRLKRYNDPDDHELETKYDTSYNFDIKQTETLSPLKNPENVYFKIYDLLRSNLNWEKQFKAVDFLRKILYYNPEIISKDNYYFSLVFDELIVLLSNLRTILVRNSLFALNDIFEFKGVSLLYKYEIILKSLIKKILDKNEFISKESDKVLKTFINNCEINKTINVLLSISESNNNNLEFLKICFNIWISLIRIYKKEVIKTRGFVNLMNIVTEAFNKNGGLKKEIKSFFKEMQCYYQNKDKFKSFIRKYFSEESYEKILIWVN